VHQVTISPTADHYALVALGDTFMCAFLLSYPGQTHQAVHTNFPDSCFLVNGTGNGNLYPSSCQSLLMKSSSPQAIPRNFLRVRRPQNTTSRRTSPGEPFSTLRDKAQISIFSVFFLGFFFRPSSMPCARFCAGFCAGNMTT
jgi:hypothetical protein